MGYDLHVVRTEDWLDASQNPIGLDEVQAAVAVDSELSLDADQFVAMSDAKGRTHRYPIVSWRGRPIFWWYQDQLISSSPTEAVVGKLLQIAERLGARVIGDDGELYP
jgi:hypothetical protein